MKKTIKISGSISGVIATGSFQNLRPSFTWEEEFELDPTVGDLFRDEDIQARRKVLYEKSFALLKEVEALAIKDRIERELETIRFRTNPKTGKIHPSITSVINWDADFYVPAHELQQYASSGSITHARCAEFITNGVWIDGKTLQDVWADIVIVTQGTLKLPINVGNLPLFLEKYPIDGLINGETVYLDNTAGLPDAHGTPHGWKEAKEIPSTIDFKRTPSKIKDGMQLSQYCKAKGHKQGIITPINDNTAQGWSKPIIYDEKALNGYDKLFQKKRKDFFKRYGI